MSEFLVEPIETSVLYTVGLTPADTFAVPFPFDDPEDLVVLVDGATATFTVISTTSIDGFTTQGSIELTTPVTDCTVSIQRQTALQQEVRYPESGQFRVRPLNREISRIWMAIQDRFTDLGYKLGVPAGELKPALFPNRETRSGCLAAFDMAGDPTTIDPDTVLDELNAGIIQFIIEKALEELFPAGLILFWSGSAASIPAKYALCDGTNGTPDLRDLFIIGAGGTFAPGEEGGSLVTENSAPANATTTGTALTTAQMPTHNHGGVTSQNNNTHYHGMAGTTPAQPNRGAQVSWLPGNSNNYILQPGGTDQIYTADATDNHQHTINPQGDGEEHDHDVTLPAHNHDANRPPYYALCVIMRVGSFVSGENGVFVPGDMSSLANKVSHNMALSDETTEITAGTGKMSWRCPRKMVIEELILYANTASSSGPVIVDMNVDGASILSTKLSISEGEVSSEAAGTTQPVIQATTLNKGALISWDFDDAGVGVTGLKVIVNGYLVT